MAADGSDEDGEGSRSTLETASDADGRLEGRHVVLTGGTNGIGRGIADRIVAAGGDVSVFDVDVEPDANAATVSDRDFARGRRRFYRVDVRNPEEIERALEAATAASGFGPVDGLVNNAGIQRFTPFLETSEDDWADHLAVNATGTFRCSKLVAERLVDRGAPGSIVNVASSAVSDPVVGQAAYAASKGAVASFTLALSTELAPHGITVNAVNPGPVRTEMYDEFVAAYADHLERPVDDVIADAERRSVASRLGQPRDVGNLCVFLLSAESEWITGEQFDVDGTV